LPSIYDYVTNEIPLGDGGEIALGAGATLNVTAGDVYFGQYSEIIMADSSSLNISGATSTLLLSNVEDFSFANLQVVNMTTMGASLEFRETLQTSGEVRIFRSNGTFGDNVTATGDFQPLASNFTLAEGRNIIADKEFEIVGGDGESSLTVSGSSTITAREPFIGNFTSEFLTGGIARLIVKEHGGSPFTFNMGIFHLTGELIVDEGAELNVNASNQWNGDPDYYYANKQYDFIIGKVGSDIGFSTDDPGDVSGLFLMKNNSRARIDGRAYFGSGAQVNVGLNTLEVTGDTIFKSGSTLIVGRTDTASGKIAIGGETTIEKGANLAFGDTVSMAINPANRVILTSSGGFADDTLFWNPYFSLGQDANSVYIDGFTGGQGLVGAVTGGRGVTPNMSQGAGLISQILLDRNSPDDLVQRLYNSGEAILSLKDENPAAAEVALRQLFGEEALQLVSATVDTIHQVSSVIGRRISYVRSFGSSPAAGYGGASEHMWVSGFGTWARQKNTEVYGYNYNASGLVLGYDHEFDSVPGLTLGLSGSLSKGTLKNNDHLAETDVDTYALGVYGAYEWTNGLFLEGNLGYGWADNRSTIRLPYANNAIKTADFDSHNFQAGFNVGYGLRLAADTLLTPSVGLRYVNVNQDGWRERISSDPDNAAVANWCGDSRQNFLEIPLGLKVESSLQVQTVGIEPELHVGWVFTPNEPRSEMRMGFVGSDRSVSIVGTDPGRSRFLAGTGLKVQATDYVDFGINYEIEAKKNYTSHYGSLTLGVSF
jgi:outer membrane autotransporter protein